MQLQAVNLRYAGHVDMSRTMRMSAASRFRDVFAEVPADELWNITHYWGLWSGTGNPTMALAPAAFPWNPQVGNGRYFPVVSTGFASAIAVATIDAGALTFGPLAKLYVITPAGLAADGDMTVGVYGLRYKVAP